MFSNSFLFYRKQLKLKREDFGKEKVARNVMGDTQAKK